MDSRLVPRLTKFRWTSEFKVVFKEYALTCGEAGEIIINGRDVVLARPDRKALVVPQPVLGVASLKAMDTDLKDILAASAGYQAA